MKTYGEAAREMACVVYTVRNYKISNALPSLLTRLVEWHHIDNKKTPVDCEQAPDDYHYKISNAPLAAGAARGMACAIYKTKKYLLIVSKLPSGDIFLSCALLILQFLLT